MRRNPGFALQVEKRISRLHETVRLDTNEMRNKWITELDSLFDTATSIAKGEVSQQQVGDKLQTVTPKERQMWAQLAASIGTAMGNLTEAYDERQIDKDLDLLEVMLKKTAGKTDLNEARDKLEAEIRSDSLQAPE